MESVECDQILFQNYRSERAIAGGEREGARNVEEERCLVSSIRRKYIGNIYFIFDILYYIYVHDTISRHSDTSERSDTPSPTLLALLLRPTPTLCYNILIK